MERGQDLAAKARDIDGDAYRLNSCSDGRSLEAVAAAARPRMSNDRKDASSSYNRRRFKSY